MGWGPLVFGRDSRVGLVPLWVTLFSIFSVTAGPENARYPLPNLARMMRERLSAYTGYIAELREQIVDPTGVVFKPIENVLLPPPWVKGRTIIIGDAAHATTPHLAQGAAMAIEDAVLLGELLGREDPLELLLGGFMARQFERARFVIESSRQISAWEQEQWRGIKNPEARPGEILREATMGLMGTY